MHFTDDEIGDYEVNGSAGKFQNWNFSPLATCCFQGSQLFKTIH